MRDLSNLPNAMDYEFFVRYSQVVLTESVSTFGRRRARRLAGYGAGRCAPVTLSFSRSAGSTFDLALALRRRKPPKRRRERPPRRGARGAESSSYRAPRLSYDCGGSGVGSLDDDSVAGA